MGRTARIGIYQVAEIKSSNIYAACSAAALAHRFCKKIRKQSDPLNLDLWNVIEVGVLGEDHEAVTYPGSSDPHIHNVWTPA